MAENDSLLLHELLFVLNPISGDIDKEGLETRISTYCENHGRQASFFHTTGTQDLLRLQQHLATHQPQAVFACGGDGTVNLVGEALVGTGRSVPMGILPLGSGNGLSKDLGIGQDLNEALRVVWQHRVRPIDTLRVGGHFSAHLADLGFNALIVDRFAQGGTRGPGAYVRIAMQEYLEYEPVTYRIETDQETFIGPAFMLTVANARTFGSNVVINPASHLDDGCFEVCLIEPFPAAAAPGILYRLYTEGFDESDYTRRLKCRHARISIEGAAEALVQVDGEPLCLPMPMQIEMHPQSLRVLVPPEL